MREHVLHHGASVTNAWKGISVEEGCKISLTYYAESAHAQVRQLLYLPPPPLSLSLHASLPLAIPAPPFRPMAKRLPALQVVTPECWNRDNIWAKNIQSAFSAKQTVVTSW